MPALQLDAVHYRLSFLRPFGVAHGTRAFTDAIFVRAAFGEHKGYGEAAVPPYLGYDTPELVRSFGTWFPNQMEDSSAIRNLLVTFSRSGTEIPKPLRCAVDIALHDLLGKMTGTPIRSVFGIPKSDTECAFTIGIGTVQDLMEQVHAHPEVSLFKLKLGGAEDRFRVEALLGLGHTSMVGASSSAIPVDVVSKVTFKVISN